MSSWSGLYGRLEKKIVKSEPRTQSISAATQWARDKLDIRLDRYKVARPQVDLAKVQGVPKLTHHPAPFSQEKLEKLCSAAGSTGTEEVAEVAPDNVAAAPTPGRANRPGRPLLTDEQKAARAAAKAARTPEQMAEAAEASAARQAARAAKIREAAARAQAPAGPPPAALVGGGGGGGGEGEGGGGGGRNSPAPQALNELFNVRGGRGGGRGRGRSGGRGLNLGGK